MVPNALIFTVAVIGTISQSDQVEGIKCFVCLPKKEDRTISQTAAMFTKMFDDKTDNIPDCQHYHKSWREMFIKDCPKGYDKGCLTQFEPNGSVMRICSKISYNRCQELGDTTYCYCSDDLCNTPDMKLADPKPTDAIGTSEPGYLKKTAEAEEAEEEVEGSADDEDLLGHDPYDDTLWTEYDPADYADVTEPTPDIRKQLEEEEEARLNSIRNRPTKPPQNPNLDIDFDDDRGKSTTDVRDNGASGAEKVSTGAMVVGAIVAAGLVGRRL